MLNELKSIFGGKWNEDQQKKFSLGFFMGFALTMFGWGVGWVIVEVLKAFHI